MSIKFKIEYASDYGIKDGSEEYIILNTIEELLAFKKTKGHDIIVSDNLSSEFLLIVYDSYLD